MRYHTTHSRAFYKALTALLKLRAEKQKAERGFVAKKCAEDNQRIKNGQHEMKKQAHSWDMAKKDAQVCHQILTTRFESSAAERQFPGFQAQYEADLAKKGLNARAA